MVLYIGYDFTDKNRLTKKQKDGCAKKQMAHFSSYRTSEDHE